MRAIRAGNSSISISIELIDGDLEEQVHPESLPLTFALLCPDLLQTLLFQTSEFAVGDNQKVSAATCRVQKRQIGQLFVKALQAAAQSLSCPIHSPNSSRKRGRIVFQNILKRCVVRTEVTTFGRCHDILEHRAKDGW